MRSVYLAGLATLLPALFLAARASADPVAAVAFPHFRVQEIDKTLTVGYGVKLVDIGGVAVEDLAAADLNGDRKIDMVAVGRATHNVRIYWNEGTAAGGEK